MHYALILNVSKNWGGVYSNERVEYKRGVDLLHLMVKKIIDYASKSGVGRLTLPHSPVI